MQHGVRVWITTKLHAINETNEEDTIAWCLTLTELPKLPSSNIRVNISGRTEDERRAKAKKGSNVLTIQTLVGFREKGKGKHFGNGISGGSAHHANLTSVEDYDYYHDEDIDESANA